MNSGRIVTQFWCAKIRMIRSLGDRIFQPWLMQRVGAEERASCPARELAQVAADLELAAEHPDALLVHARLLVVDVACAGPQP